MALISQPCDRINDTCGDGEYWFNVKLDLKLYLDETLMREDSNKTLPDNCLPIFTVSWVAVSCILEGKSLESTSHESALKPPFLAKGAQGRGAGTGQGRNSDPHELRAFQNQQTLVSQLRCSLRKDGTTHDPPA